jgi:ribosomal protein S13
MIYKRSEIAGILGISPRTLQRIMNRENFEIRKKVRLTKRDIQKIDSILKTNVSAYIR